MFLYLDLPSFGFSRFHTVFFLGGICFFFFFFLFCVLGMLRAGI